MQVHFGIEDQKNKDLAVCLQKALANTFSVYINTLNCHWNMEDPRFFFFHKMLEEQYENLADNIDEIAERIRQMGAKVPVSLGHFAKQSDIQPISELASANEMLSKLADSHEKIILSLRDVSKSAEKYNDFGLVDLLGKLLRDHEKTAWILRSHL